MSNDPLVSHRLAGRGGVLPGVPGVPRVGVPGQQGGRLDPGGGGGPKPVQGPWGPLRG
ncbi:MAG: hypothetical protein GY820_15670 [Gammaproteobacteria bacterium]|nr:hypothetical protein [Gammaproteobacteria bacterium]